MKLAEIAKFLDSTLNESADPNLEIHGISTLGEASEGEITFVADKKYLAGLSSTRASAVLIPANLAPASIPYISLPDVWSGTLKLLKHFHPGFARKSYSGIHPTAVIDPSAQLGSNVDVSPLAVIGPDAVIGDSCYIGPGAVIGARCHIGANSVLYANVVLEADTILGSDIYIQPGAVLGADGFKYELIKGRWTKIPQVGHVELGDGAEVGANTCIDRASYTLTSVGPNTKIDNLVQVAHNVTVGQNSIIVSQSGVAGSTTIGNNTILAAQVGIADNLTIGNQSVVLAQSGVKDDIKDGETWFGTPALPFRQAARIIGLENKLPELAAEIARLTKKVAELEEKLKDK